MIPVQNKNKNKNKQKKGTFPGAAARAVRIKGNGDYESIKNSILSVIRPAIKSALEVGGASLGSAVGNMAGPGGAMVGASAGKMLAQRFSKLIGTGDYSTNLSDVAHNSLVKYSGASEYASFSDSKTSVRLRHREYLQDVFVGTSGVFSNTAFAINPGLSNTFPFLSQIAGNFEEYHMHGLVFEFVSTTSPYNSTSAMGSVIMAMEYNANSPLYTSKPQMENSDFAVSARPDKSMIYGVECANNATNNYYVRQGSGTLPLTTTDIGTFQVATLTPLATGVTLGELWVSYDVELFRPHVSASRFGYAHWALSAAAATPAGRITSTRFPIDSGGPSNGVRYGSASTFVLGASDSVPTVTLTDADVGDTYMIVIGSTSTSGVAQDISVVTVGLTATSTLSTAGAVYATNVTKNAISGNGLTAVYYYTVTSNSVTPSITLTTTQATVLAGKWDLVLTNLGNGLGTWSNNILALL